MKSLKDVMNEERFINEGTSAMVELHNLRVLSTDNRDLADKDGMIYFITPFYFDDDDVRNSPRITAINYVGNEVYLEIGNKRAIMQIGDFSDSIISNLYLLMKKTIKNKK